MPVGCHKATFVPIIVMKTPKAKFVSTQYHFIDFYIKFLFPMLK